MRYPLISQGTLLAIGLIVPVGVPLVMGLDYYGRFVSATASAFLIQRLADFPSETLIFQGDRQLLLRRSAALQASFFVVGGLLSQFTMYKVDLVFLLGLQCSSVAFSLVLWCKNERLTLWYLASFLVVYLVALASALLGGQRLEFAISIPNYLALAWIPIVLTLSVDRPAPPAATGPMPRRAIIDFPLRLAAGSFFAIATLGLASLAASDTHANAAQIRLLGTALGFAAFLLPWPLKSLVGIFQSSRAQQMAMLSRYLRGTRLTAAALIAAAMWSRPLAPYLACAAVCLVFINYMVIERWNVFHGDMPALARTALVASLVTLAAFELLPGKGGPILHSSVAILLGSSAYCALSWWASSSGEARRGISAESAALSFAGALALYLLGSWA